MTSLMSDPKNLLLAIASGLIPAIFWLWFWLKNEDNQEPEPIGLIIMSFVLGGLMVFLAIFFEKYSLNFITENKTKIIVWAIIEEVLKLLATITIIYKNKNINNPIDYPMYFIAVSLGFAAFENILYLLNPINSDGAIIGMITGNLRFLGATLLHAISGAIMGSALGLAFFIEKHKKKYLLIGLMLAIILHSVFNFFIMKEGGKNFLSVFGFLWVVTIINMLIFEKLKRMSKNLLINN